LTQIDSSIAVAAIMAIGQIGAVKLLVTSTLKKIDANTETTQSHSVLLAHTAEILATVQNQVAEVAHNQKDLFESRNRQEKALVAVDTLHELKGCKITLFQGHK
jgi:hypothetical protein